MPVGNQLRQEAQQIEPLQDMSRREIILLVTSKERRLVALLQQTPATEVIISRRRRGARYPDIVANTQSAALRTISSRLRQIADLRAIKELEDLSIRQIMKYHNKMCSIIHLYELYREFEHWMAFTLPRDPEYQLLNTHLSERAAG
ncbi:hypothetical protein GCK72_023714 [Caenorhabditis remanei]|uniref:Uncharacterized protein n=1 Tax=Caenorhabditis remanei TaxID=31234 RepID=A0A6A5FXK1_CAERE|nr:hypothetical protein GCK72_023714 [Caenorhabditis remanei]KAF1747252.1 hypothetical protein GCK72_023714 [Caenorhabditis remanei]